MKADVLNEQVTRDLAKHLRIRVAVVLEDLLDTMRLAGIPNNVRHAIIIRNLILQAAVVAIANEAPRQGFLRVCEDLYNEAMQHKDDP
jgi:hypothetical protein